MSKSKTVKKPRSKDELESERKKREQAREFFKADPVRTANDLYTHLVGLGYPLKNDKKFNVWANNQKRAALGTTPAAKEHDRLERMKAIAAISKTLGGIDKATEVLQQLKKIGDIATALKSLKEYGEVVKVAGKEDQIVKFLDAMIENVR